MPKSPEPTTINSVLEDYDRTFPMDWPSGLGSDRQADRVAFKAFLRSAILKTCEEILAVAPKRKNTHEGNCPNHPSLCSWCFEQAGFNQCQYLIESKVKEIKNS